MDVQPELPQIKIKLDTREYYKKFSQMHGGHPIIYKEKQLFADGWTYSLSDYQGPEWPPPTDPKELREMQIAYWLVRWNRARKELLVLRGRLNALQGLQAAKSAPLQMTIVEQDQDTGKKYNTTSDLNLKVFDSVIHWLEQEESEANAKLTELRNVVDDKKIESFAPQTEARPIIVEDKPKKTKSKKKGSRDEKTKV